MVALVTMLVGGRTCVDMEDFGERAGDVAAAVPEVENGSRATTRSAQSSVKRSSAI